MSEDVFAELYGFEEGAGGVVCKALIQTGYKVFATGFGGNDQAKTFFPAPARESDKQAAAKAQAQALQNQHGCRMNFGIQIRAFKDTAARGDGSLTEWNYDQFYYVAKFSDAARDTVFPSMKDADIADAFVKNGYVWEGWVRLGYKDSPWHTAQGEAGKTATDRENKPKYPQFAYIVEAFADEDAARAAIGEVEESGNGESPWEDADAWFNVAVPEMYKLSQEGRTNAQLATDYGVNVSDVVKGLANYIPM